MFSQASVCSGWRSWQHPIHHGICHMVGYPLPRKGQVVYPQHQTWLPPPGHQTCGPPTSHKKEWHQTWGPPVIVTSGWWWSLETCSNLFKLVHFGTETEAWNGVGGTSGFLVATETEGNIFRSVCQQFWSGGCAWLFGGQFPWFYSCGHVRILLECMCGFIWGVCVVLFGGCMWFYLEGLVWFFVCKTSVSQYFFFHPGK